MAETRRYKILLGHNHYLERGGEDESFEAEKSLLLENGHETCQYIRSNHEIDSYDWRRKLTLPLRIISAWDSREDIQNLILTERPKIAHFNNTFPLISPGVYAVCREMNVPVVQNLRNYRLLCPNALFFRDHHICEDCLAWKMPLPAIVHACYRDSHFQSAVVAGMLAYHRWRNTWKSKVNIFVALTEFSRLRYIAGGIPAEKIVVKPNFVQDTGKSRENGDYVVFVGRLVEEKGIMKLIKAWKSCRNIPLKIIGDGPLHQSLAMAIAEEQLDNVRLLGRLPASKISGLIKGARFVVFPSIWYEAFPRVLLEAFVSARTVIASNVGASPEIIDHGRTGLLFDSQDLQDLVEKINYLWSRPDLSVKLGQEARLEYQLKYTPQIAYQAMMNIYSVASSLG